MKKSLIWISLCAILSLSIQATGSAFLFDNAVDKAKDLMKANMAPQAVELLQKEIKENPTNAEAHLELGNIYLQQGNYSAAEDRFKGAAGLKPGLKGKIGEKCVQTGYSILDSGINDVAQKAFNIAVMFDPSLKESIGGKLAQTGNTLITDGKNSAAIHAFTIAAQFKPSIKGDAGEKLAQVGYKLLENRKIDKVEEAFLAFNTAKNFKPGIEKEIGKRILDVFNLIPNGTPQNADSSTSETALI